MPNPQDNLNSTKRSLKPEESIGNGYGIPVEGQAGNSKNTNNSTQSPRLYPDSPITSLCNDSGKTKLERGLDRGHDCRKANVATAVVQLKKEDLENFIKMIAECERARKADSGGNEARSEREVLDGN
jgi:hypothetical protein